MTTSSRARQLLLHQHHHHQRHRLQQQTSSSSWSLGNIIQLLSSQQVSCEELAQHCYATATAGESIWKLRAFSRLLSWQQIQAEAQASDERRRAGTPKSPLDGIPISVKANVAVKHQALTAGSRILGESNFAAPAPAVGYNAELVQFLVEECGAICIGITNMDEFGMGSLGTNVVGGPTKNPLAFYNNFLNETTNISLVDYLQQSPDEIAELHEQYCGNNYFQGHHYSAGGSSCGAAASICHGSSLIALGSDTGGSIRLPAAWCGVVGMKTSYGTISRHGLVSYASSLDTIGFLTPTVNCASLVMEEIFDNNCHSKQKNPPKDSTSVYYSTITGTAAKEPEPKLRLLTGEIPLNGIRIGIPSAFVVEECPDSVKEVWSRGAAALEQAGATLSVLSSDSISPELIQNSLAAYYVLVSAEASSNLARYDGFRYGVAADNYNDDNNDNQSDHHAKGAVADQQDEVNDDDEGKLLQRQYASTRTQGFSLEVIRRILCGTAVLSSDKFHTHYEAAAKLRALLTQQLQKAFEDEIDYLLIPTAISSPPRLDGGENENQEEKSSSNSSKNATEMFANDIMTVPISLAGLTAVGVPFYGNEEEKSAIHSVAGLQLVGRRLDEVNLLRVARYLEEQQSTDAN